MAFNRYFQIFSDLIRSHLCSFFLDVLRLMAVVHEICPIFGSFGFSATLSLLVLLKIKKFTLQSLDILHVHNQVSQCMTYCRILIL